MRLPALITTDLHLTANPADEYRWSLFKWLAGEITAEEVQTLLILGDITDAKDYHPAELVNRLVESVTALTWLGCDVVILQGNHDYLKKGHSFFHFLNNIPRVKFITTMQDDGGGDNGPLAYFLPHTREPMKDWSGLDFSHYSYLFMHQTAPGSVASNGQAMDGDSLPSLKGPKVYSGDIHVPQVIGDVEYVGSPYHVHFGDKFKPRCVLLDRRNRPVDLHFKTVSRLALTAASISQVRAFDLKPGDQVKLTLKLDQADAHSWSRLRREAMAVLAEQKVEVHDLRLEVVRSQRWLDANAIRPRGKSILSDPEAMFRFVERDGLGADLYDAGLEAMR